MHFKPVSCLFLLIASSVSAPSRRSTLQRRDVESGPWHVTNFQDHCSPGGCVYNLDVASSSPLASPPPYAEFSTHCNLAQGSDHGDGYTNCEDRSVSFKIDIEDLGTVFSFVHSFQNDSYGVGTEEQLFGASPTLKSPFPAEFDIAVSATALAAPPVIVTPSPSPSATST
ncbi:MAG: hypothetical protein Q9160_005936 [Pyrenula sp. 1 TL-2023]